MTIPPNPPTPGTPDPSDAPVPLSPVLDPGVHDPYAALKNPNYRRFFVGNAFSLIGTNMTTAVVSYELYQRTKDPGVLGLVGLVQVIPIILLALPAGHLLDRFNRQKLLIAATVLQIFLWAAAGFSSRFAYLLGGIPIASFISKDPHVPILLFLLLLNGVARAINQPARHSLLPMLVPASQFPNAITWNATLYETCNIVGPMAAGFAIAALIGSTTLQPWTFALLYWINALFQLIQCINVYRIRLVHKPRAQTPLSIQSLISGVLFVHRNKIILSALTLDMFAVLLGGATALLPVFADKILHVGPIGFAWLRAAPSIGAISMAIFMAHRRPMEHAGRNLLWCVAGFGAAIVVFGLSQNFWISIAALIVTGIFDNVSVVVRHSLVQLQTPDDMRGRVSAVNSVFISTSNELGETESGYTAKWSIALAARAWGPVVGEVWGPMLAVAAGGVGTIVVVAIVAMVWPEIRAVGRLEAKH